MLSSPTSPVFSLAFSVHNVRFMLASVAIDPTADRTVVRKYPSICIITTESDKYYSGCWVHGPSINYSSENHLTFPKDTTTHLSEEDQDVIKTLVWGYMGKIKQLSEFINTDTILS